MYEYSGTEKRRLTKEKMGDQHHEDRWRVTLRLTIGQTVHLGARFFSGRMTFFFLIYIVKVTGRPQWRERGPMQTEQAWGRYSTLLLLMIWTSLRKKGYWYLYDCVQQSLRQKVVWRVFPTAHALRVGSCLSIRQNNPLRTVDFF